MSANMRYFKYLQKSGKSVWKGGRKAYRFFLAPLLTHLAQKSGQREVKMGGETRDIIGGKHIKTEFLS